MRVPLLEDTFVSMGTTSILSWQRGNLLSSRAESIKIDRIILIQLRHVRASYPGRKLQIPSIYSSVRDPIFRYHSLEYNLARVIIGSLQSRVSAAQTP